MTADLVLKFVHNKGRMTTYIVLYNAHQGKV